MAFLERKVIEMEWNDDTKGIEIVGRLTSVEVVQYKDGPGLVFTLIDEKTPGKSFVFVEQLSLIESYINPMWAR